MPVERKKRLRTASSSSTDAPVDAAISTSEVPLDTMIGETRRRAPRTIHKGGAAGTTDPPADGDWGLGSIRPRQLFPLASSKDRTAKEGHYETMLPTQRDSNQSSGSFSEDEPSSSSPKAGYYHYIHQVKATETIVNAVMALTLDSVFVGNCIAVTGQVVLTAGHHFNSSKDDPSRFAVISRRGDVFPAEFVLKNSKRDVALFWVSRSARLPSINLRGFRPPVGSRVATVWMNSLPPHHDLLTTPGVVISSERGLCQARGSVTSGGTSGAPVVDSPLGSIVVGIHLSSNKKDGSRVSEFVPSADILVALAESGISLRVEADTYPKS